ncbi:leucyl/phenylalanyl-tRNA--protein transferase [Lichenicola sp.]|uniref:leucyl/phenylalanyl-tRNA--protein transferase n=1 Tax=Lichenicola sp. TaxID=2804529 RepID=UPI003B00F56E
MPRTAPPLTAELMLQAYRVGLFPMAENRGSTRLYWLDPEMRGVLPLDRFHLSRRLRRTVLSDTYTVTADRQFQAVIAACAAPDEGREESWINPEIEWLFTELHRRGAAHSVECLQDGELVGGLYGVAIGAAFFGESMFSRARDASKVALVHLVARLRLGGFSLLDTQFTTSHLTQFGAHEIARAEYRRRLGEAVSADACWTAAPAPDALAGAIAGLRAQPGVADACGTNRAKPCH